MQSKLLTTLCRIYIVGRGTESHLKGTQNEITWPQVAQGSSHALGPLFPQLPSCFSHFNCNTTHPQAESSVFLSPARPYIEKRYSYTKYKSVWKTSIAFNTTLHQHTMNNQFVQRKSILLGLQKYMHNYRVGWPLILILRLRDHYRYKGTIKYCSSAAGVFKSSQLISTVMAESALCPVSSHSCYHWSRQEWISHFAPAYHTAGWHPSRNWSPPHTIHRAVSSGPDLVTLLLSLLRGTG